MNNKIVSSIEQEISSKVSQFESAIDPLNEHLHRVDNNLLIILATDVFPNILDDLEHAWLSTAISVAKEWILSKLKSKYSVRNFGSIITKINQM